MSPKANKKEPAYAGFFLVRFRNTDQKKMTE